MKTFRPFVPGLLFLAAFLVLTVLICYVDVQPSGSAYTDLGLATINTNVRDAIGESKTMFTLTEILGYLTWGVVAFFGLLGLSQLVHRQSLLKVDRDIILLGFGYVIMLACYVLFDRIPINYRPYCSWRVELVSSYPSSHTLMIVFVMATAVMQILRRMRAGLARNLLIALCIITATVVTVGRLLSGVHWLTDILGGLLLGAALAALYGGLIKQKAEA
jgi:Membrane-associated phospholipid phosphatase